MRFSDEEMEAVRSHYGVASLDPDIEAKLLDDAPEDSGYIDSRLRQRYLLKIWAGRKASKGDVHTSHCCEKHGCKYGDDGCSVMTKASVQEYLCESCEDDVRALRAAFPLAKEYALSVAFRAWTTETMSSSTARSSGLRSLIRSRRTRHSMRTWSGRSRPRIWPAWCNLGLRALTGRT